MCNRSSRVERDFQGDVEVVKSPIFESELTTGLAERFVDGLDRPSLSRQLQELVSVKMYTI